ncbi:type II toxin-antitoxin system Phd/YefM family antitoxin [Aphanizomenon sp. UHCC 0183]|uniref:type II toxin-antitoxin system Phd/YefM family antitoxin n=1 Tax=Aphanizomenon sp. UHCC 0183 TaxID=2590028 RepID=UPI0014460B1A|nr:type II toxin-antitoxin system Phd/YefM family antitoxin [Aphanizomenon sp. UHCC 0183]MTJ31689.1 type II toxin-antitoxin system Phd/YefM family antitoxin [Aphanizomenon sp. UHCC 0183]
MRQVSVSEVKKDFAYIMDSTQQEPILVKENDRNYVAIISMNDYEDLVKIKNLRLKNISADLGAEAQANGLTLELLNEILNSYRTKFF